MNDERLVLRLIELYRSELTLRLLPRVAATINGVAQRISGNEAANPLANAILEDAVSSIGFGYRLERDMRRALVHEISQSGDGSNPLRLGVPFQPLVLRRAELYLRMVETVAEELGYHDSIRKLVGRCRQIVTDALSTDARSHTQIAFWSVEKAVANRKPPTGSLSKGQRKLLEDALRNSLRTLIDPHLETAVALLRRSRQHRSDEDTLSINAKAWLMHYLRDEAAGYASDKRRPSDPMAFFWALEELSEHGDQWTRKAARIATTFWKSHSGRDFRRLFKPRPRTPITRELPEIGEGTFRSECLSLLSLCRLERAMRPLGLDVKVVSDLSRFFLKQVLGASSSTSDDGERHFAGFPGGRPNMYVLALHLWALETYQRLVAERTNAPTPPGAEVDPNYQLRFKDAIQHALEFNLEEHRLFGDFLVWNRSSEKHVRIKDQLTSTIDHYFASSLPRPLNILICAGPGTGKSFFIKNALKESAAAEHLKLIEINATQLRTADDLFSHFRKVTSQIAESGKGLLFLDEADTLLPSKEYLFAHLLGPMWDGEYVSSGDTLVMKRLVWLFAVSKESSVKKFERWLDRENIQKSRDFLSRIYLKFDLPDPGSDGNVLTFLGNVRRIYGSKVTRCSREVLNFFGTHAFWGAREIEKCVLFMTHDNGSVTMSSLPESFRKEARIISAAAAPLIAPETADEWVSIVDF